MSSARGHPTGTPAFTTRRTSPAKLRGAGWQPCRHPDLHTRRMENLTIGGVPATAGSYGTRWQAHAGVQGRGSLNRLCALVADDEADSREAVAVLLRWCGYDVKLAADGEQALQIAKDYRPELIFLDIGMPIRDGYEVCRRLRQSPEFAHARIVAVSGYSGEAHDVRCSEAGFTAQMPKPLEPAVLEKFAEGTPD